MGEYAAMSAQLARVRQAWKRAAALSGLALAFVELLGIFSVALLIDVLYRPGPVVRAILLAVVLAAFVFLLVRHVVKPLFRHIPDEQIALYIEEHNPGFEGALMTAAEFRDRAGDTSEQARLVEAIIREAVRRSSQLDLRRVVDLGRLRKYGLLAALVLFGYLFMGALFPQSLGYHTLRVATPWIPEAAEGDGTLHRVSGGLSREPIRFRLTPEHPSVARGQPFRLEAVLSRFPDRPVLFLFRPQQADAAARWMELPMQELDRLNAYTIELPDVNEPLEFRVASGEFQSDVHKLEVYEPIALRGIELRIRYPDYLKMPEAVDPQASGDVAAPVGSQVTVRIQANNPLKSGRLLWPGQPAQEMDVQTGDAPSVSATFELKTDAQYEFLVRDIHGQEAKSPGPLNVRALQDKAPEMSVTLPKVDITTHPLGEITFVAEVTDDFGVDAVDVVCQPSREGQAEFRIPLALEPRERLTRPPYRDARAQGLLAFENHRPQAQPTDTYTYYFEARDAKGQVVTSDLYVINVGHFETWATWQVMPPEIGAPELMPPPLTMYLAAAWHLHTQKPQLKPDDFGRQSEELAASMEDPGTKKPFEYGLPPKGVVWPPERMAHVEACNRHVNAAYTALQKPHDTGAAVNHLRLALAELNILGISDTAVVKTQSGSGGAPELKEDPFSQIRMAMEKAQAEALASDAAASLPTLGPGYRRELRKLEEAEKVKKKAEELQNEVKELAELTREAAQAKPDAASQPQPSAPKPQTRDTSKPDQERPMPPDRLAEAQERAAQKAKEVAEEAQKAAELDPQFRQAAQNMNQAANELFNASQQAKQNEMQKSSQEVEKAAKNIEKAVAALDKLRQHNLEKTLDKLETALQRLHNEQKMMRRQTEAVAEKERAGQKPDAQQERDLKSMPLRQAQVRQDTEALSKELEKQFEAARNAQREDVARQLDNAKQAERRGQVTQKMDNAVVALNQKDIQAAAAEQKKAEHSLEKMLDSVRSANDALASDLDSELRRALNESQRIDRKLSEMNPQAPPDESQAQGRPDETNARTPDATKGEEKTKPQTRPEEKGETGREKPLSPQQRREAAENLAFEMQRFVRHLENRNLADPDDARKLKEAVERPEELGLKAEEDPRKLEPLRAIVRRVNDKLEKEVEARLEAKRLFSAKREEVPPQYRQLVNQYYEALGKAKQ